MTTFIFKGKYVFLTCATLCKVVMVPPSQFFKLWIAQNFVPCIWVNMEAHKSTVVNKVHESLKAFIANHDPFLCRNLTTLESMVTR